jgi:exonuclease SbcC
MRIESVTAHAFGPLTNVTLDLAPGMTVITGVNESAKSSWHAAIYTALVGRHKGKGASTKEERHFADLHKPWDGPDWRVSAIITLDDGRRIELTHDLDAKVDCRAMDLGLSRDVSNEIMFEGSPDASRFLGLDRKSFVATAVVNQAEMLTILSVADGLQEHLQRAAATAGTDATAAAALAALEDFNRERVGLDRANSSKPLRAAKNRLAGAEAASAKARDDHDDYLRLVTDAEAHHARAKAATTTTGVLEATLGALDHLLTCARTAADAQKESEHSQDKAASAARKALTLTERVDRARGLDNGFGGVAPVGAVEAESTSRAVAGALATWKTAPSPQLRDGPSAAQIQADLDSLPPPPQGDIALAATVQAAAAALAQTRAVMAAHAEQEPAAPIVAPDSDDTGLDAAVAAGPAVVRELAAQLNAASTPAITPTAGSTLAESLEQARQKQQETAAALADAEAAEAAARTAYDTVTAPSMSVSPAQTRSRTSRRPVMAAVAVVCAAAGVALFVMQQLVPGIVAIVVATVLAAAAAMAKSGGGTTQGPPAERSSEHPEAQRASLVLREAAERLTRAQQDVFAASRSGAEFEGRASAEAAAQRGAASARAEIEARCNARDLPVDPTRLQHLAAVAEQVLDHRSLHARWSSTADGYARDLKQAETRLRDQLVAHGQPADPATAVMDLVSAYERACEARAALAAGAARRPVLVKALADRTSTEEAARTTTKVRDQADRGLRDAARAAGVDAGGDDSATPQDLVAALEAWQVTYEEQLSAAAEARRGWADLQAVLNGATLEELTATRDAAVVERDALVEAAAATTAAAAQAVSIAIEAANSAAVDETAAGDVNAVTELLTAAREEVKASREEMLTLARLAEKAGGVAAERARSLVSVPEADEAVAAAEEELDRVEELAATLEWTHEFLATAQEQVHRDIAPVLANTLRAWLPKVTAGRYIDASVDPATLQVKVTGPGRRWRAADRLSVGTAEQVYLLLRVALAQHLTTTNEACPLLLDDVTVQADDERAKEVLDLLLRLSEDRQIVLFAQESTVAAWAAQNLAGKPEHLLIELPQVSVE